MGTMEKADKASRSELLYVCTSQLYLQYLLFIVLQQGIPTVVWIDHMSQGFNYQSGLVLQCTHFLDPGRNFRKLQRTFTLQRKSELQHILFTHQEKSQETALQTHHTLDTSFILTNTVVGFMASSHILLASVCALVSLLLQRYFEMTESGTHFTVKVSDAKLSFNF